jgi:hypothetical protein
MLFTENAANSSLRSAPDRKFDRYR